MEIQRRGKYQLTLVVRRLIIIITTTTITTITTTTTTIMPCIAVSILGKSQMGFKVMRKN